MVQMKRLYDLQELDWEISAREKSLAEARARLADDSALVAARKALQETEGRLSGKATARRQVEFAVQQLTEKIDSVDRRLYGGSVTNPRELTALEEERRMLQRQRGAEEEKLLELLVEIEDLQAASARAQEELRRIQSAREAEVEELEKAEHRLVSELESLRKDRDQVVPSIPPNLLAVYESLLKTRGGHAVARVERSVCQGCRISLPMGEVQRARSSQGIVQCSSCRRILYVV